VEINDDTHEQRADGSPMKRVHHVVAAAELAKQRARLYSRARVFIAAKYLGDTDPTIDFEAVASVLSELLLAANAANQRAEALLTTPLRAAKADD
jgi:hypothetical protein